MKKKKKLYIIPVIFSVLLIGFTVYVALDTFVISHVYDVVTTAQTTESTSENAEALKPVITDTSYKDKDISIKLSTYREYDSDVYVANIRLTDAKYLKTALAKGSYGRNIAEKTSTIATENNAILAVNGDYYGAQEKGYVLRNGVLYRDTVSSGNEDLVIYKDGSFEYIKETDISASELAKKGAEQIIAFGPAIIEDGKTALTPDEEHGIVTAKNPRTAIGVIDDLHYIFVVVDGRSSNSAGMTLDELSEYMISLGVKSAYNLDGGGSSAMYFNGKLINKPTTDGTTFVERSVSDIVYIGK